MPTSLSSLPSSPATAALLGNAASFNPESWRAAEYSLYRPVYAPSIFRLILDYASLHRTLQGAQSSFVKREETVALDIGSGPGSTALALATEAAFDRIIGIDPSSRMIHEASKKTYEMRSDNELSPHVQVSFIKGVAENLGWIRDCSIDLIASSNSIQWWRDLSKAFAEFRRVLKPGGTVAIFAYTDAVIPGEEVLSHIINRYANEILSDYWVQPARELVTGMFERIAMPTNQPTKHEDAEAIDTNGQWDLGSFRRMRFDLIDADCWTAPPDHLAAEHHEPLMSARWTIEDIAGWLGTLSAATSYDEAHPDEAPIQMQLATALRNAVSPDDRDRPFDIVFPMAMLLMRKEG